MNFMKSLTLMMIFFAAVIAAYSIISPYEQCVRNMATEFDGVDMDMANTGRGVSPNDMVKMLCARQTNW